MMIAIPSQSIPPELFALLALVSLGALVAAYPEYPAKLRRLVVGAAVALSLMILGVTVFAQPIGDTCDYCPYLICWVIGCW